MFIIFNSIICGALWIEGWKEMSLIGTNPLRILPSSLLKRERRIICTKRSKTPFWSLLCCEGNTLLCQKMHGKDESKSCVKRGCSTISPLNACAHTARKEGFLFRDTLTSEWFQYDNDVVVRTSMWTQEVVIGNWPWLSKGLELVKPLAGDVELQEAGLHHVE